MDFQSNGSNGGNDHGANFAETFVIEAGAGSRRVVMESGEENQLVLPAGVTMSDIHVQGDNLVIDLPDGSQLLVVNGAIYPPQIIIDGYPVPAVQLAALIDAEAMPLNQGEVTKTVVARAGEDNVINLPAGVSLDDVRVQGDNLVITLPDGSTMLVVNGAVNVPELVLDGVAVPPMNLAALLDAGDIQPAGGAPSSSGGNFADAVNPLDPAYALGDLLPYTELSFSSPQDEQIYPALRNSDPDVEIETPDQPTGAVNATSEVNEAGLPARDVGDGPEPQGSDAASDSEIVDGTIVFETPDGFGSLTIDGVEVTEVGQVFSSSIGTLVITSIGPGEIGYTYTLKDNTSGQQDEFVVVVTDVDGDTAQSMLTISIIDDVPVARNDTDFVEAATYGPIGGNVITGADTTSGDSGADTVGADDASVTAVSGAGGDTDAFADGVLSIDGTYGSLTLASDGTYTYVRDPNTPGGVQDVFTYTLTDGDGDTSEATLTIDIGDAPPVIISVPVTGGGTIVDEDGLPPRGDEAPGTMQETDDEITSGTITFTSPDGISDVLINGESVVVGQPITIGNGTLVVTDLDLENGTLTYTYTLNDNTNGDDTSVDFDITVVDLDGDSATDTVTIDIIDDAPIAVDDFETQDSEDAPITVDAFANDTPGADDVAFDAIALVDGTLDGAGSVTYNNDGTFTYTPVPGEEGVVTFDYTITDGDGDVSRATVTITLLPDSVPTILIAEGSDTVVDEEGLPFGTNPDSNAETASGRLVITTGNDTVGQLIVDGVDVTNGGTVDGDFGTLTISGNPDDGYTYSYTLTVATTDVPNAAEQDNFAITVVDSDGDRASTELVVTIVDDQPLASPDTDFVAAGTFGPVTGNVITDAAAGDAGDADDGADNVGADGLGTLTSISSNATDASDATFSNGVLVVQGQYGVLTIEADGDYSYTRDPGTPGGVSEVFTYSFVDGDGDPASSTLTITIGDATPTIVSANNEIVALDDDALPGGIAGGPGDDSPDTANTTGTLDASGGDQPLTYSFNTDGNDLPDGFTATISAGGALLIQQNGTTVLTVTLDAAGNYTVTQNAAILHPDGMAENNLLFDIGYQVTDVDGDPATGTFTINVDDDSPDAVVVNSVADTLVLDETRPEGTETDGDSDPAGLMSVSAQFADNFGSTLAFGADGPGGVSYSLALSGSDVGSGLYALGTDGARGAEIVLNQSGDAVTGSVGDTTYFTIAVDGDTGEVTFTQFANVYHADASDDDDTSTLTLDGEGEFLNVVQTLTDADGDSDSASIALGAGVFSIEDDGPDATLASVAVDTLVLDETRPLGTDTDGTAPAGRATVTAQFADNFGAADYGTDGAGDVTYSLTLSTEGTGSGLFALDANDTSAADGDGIGQGEEIQLFSNGDTITGSVDGTDYFTITIDASSGAVTFTQLENIYQSDPSNDDEAATLTLGDGEALNVVQTVTDADGDSDSAAINLGTGVFSIQDDGPDAVVANAVADTLVLDETRPLGTETDGDSMPAGLMTTTASFADNFVTAIDYGTDGAGSVGYTLSINADGIGSGLFALEAGDTSTTDGDGFGQGEEIALFQTDATTITGSVGGVDYFTISVDADTGVVTFTQLENIYHSDAGNDDDSEALIVDGADSFTIVQTVTDADGDSDSASIDLGAGTFRIEDDGPDAIDDTNSIQTNDADGQISGNLTANDDAGTDGAAVVSANNGTTTDSTFPIVIVGQYGTLTITDGAGNYTYDLDTTNPTVATLPNDQRLTENFEYTLRDTDGDTDDADLTITIFGSNQPPIGDADAVTVSEEGLTGGNPDNVGVPQDDTNAATVTGSFGTTDADGAGFTDADGDDLTYTISAPTGTYLAADGSTITFTSQTDPVTGVQTLTGRDGNGDAVLTVELNTDTGDYEVTLNGPVFHDDAALTDPDQVNVETELTITFPVAVSDGIVTTDTTLDVTIEDDKPVVTTAAFTEPTLTVDDTTLDVDDTASFSGAFDVRYGGDGAGNTTYTLGIAAMGANSGLVDTLSGDPIFLYMDGDDVVGLVGTDAGTADPNGAEAFRVSVDADGVVELDQSRAIYHDDPTDPEESGAGEPEMLASDDLITLTATATDQDGDFDSATIDIGANLAFEDDGPSVTASVDGSTAGVLITTDDLTYATDSTFSLANVFGQSNVDYGNDGPLDADDNNVADDGALVETFGLDLDPNYDPTVGTTLSSGGDTIYLYDFGNTIVASTSATAPADATPGADTVFTVSVAADGTVTQTQYAPLDHVGTGNDNVIALPADLINGTYSVTVTDGDLDTATDTALFDLGGSLRFVDDVPDIEVNANPVADAVLDESPNGEDEGGDFDPAGRSTVTVDYSGNFNIDGNASDSDFGADVPGTIAYALNLDGTDVGSGVFALDNSDTTTTDGDGIGQGDEIVLNQVGDDIVGTANGVEYFRISVDEDTGEVTFTQSNNVYHDNPNNDDDTVAIDTVGTNVLTITATATDFDGDSDSASIDLGQGTFQIEDDGPAIETATDSMFTATDGDPALTAGGTISIDPGTDGYLGGSPTTGVMFTLLTSSTVGDTPIFNISQPTYDPADGVYEFTFDYTADDGSTQTNSGTIALNGTDYTVTLQDDFAFTDVISFSTATNREAYEIPGVSNGQSEIYVSTLIDSSAPNADDGLFVQFSGFNGNITSGGNNVFVPGEELSGSPAFVTISNAQNGVAGDTIQDGEVLDFDLFASDPMGNLALDPTTTSTALTITLDQVGNGEDFLVLLKLVDPDTGATTTRFVVVGSEDIYRSGDTIPDGFDAPVLDNNDGFVIIEQQDYLQPGENYVIEGAQFLASSSGIQGSGIDLNRAVGDGGDSTGTIVFAPDLQGGTSNTQDGDVVKITDVGLVRTVNDAQNVSLDFQVKVTDGDGDTETDTFTINPDVMTTAALSPTLASLTTMETTAQRSETRTMEFAAITALAPAIMLDQSYGADFSVQQTSIELLSVDYGSLSATTPLVGQTETFSSVQSVGYFGSAQTSIGPVEQAEVSLNDWASDNVATMFEGPAPVEMLSNDLGMSSEMAFAAPDFSPMISAPDMNVQAIDALLAMTSGPEASGIQMSGDNAVVREALNEIMENDDISQLVNHVIDLAVDSPQPDAAGSEALHAMLDNSIVGLQLFDTAALNSAGDEHAAMAVAQG